MKVLYAIYVSKPKKVTSKKISTNSFIVFQQANGGGQDIDLTLPITSTYLRRMRALGLAAGLDQAYKHPNNALQLEVSYLLR